MNFSKKNHEHIKTNRSYASKTKLTLLALLISIVSIAQNGINYKALIKDDSGNVIANTAIQIQFTIVQDITDVYTETHAPTTDANGIVIVNIGDGTLTSGDFNTINWAEENHSLNVQIDTGTGFVDLGTTQFMSVPYAKHAETAANASNVNGLEAIDEGNGIGWRLVGRNAANYDNIGFNAIDLSFVDDPNLELGATGNYAFSLGHNGTASGEHALAFGNQNYALNDYAIAIGNNNTVSGLNSTAIGAINQVSGDYALAAGLQNVASENYTVALGANTTASGEYGIAMGRNTTASAGTSTAMGASTTASGFTSTAMGSGTTASGLVSTAMGAFTAASGDRSTAMGISTDATGLTSTAMGGFTTASGDYSTAMGFITNSEAYGSIAIGRYNIGGGNPTSWIDSDPLFEIGNGTSGSNRNNALTVSKSGRHSINSNSSGLTISASTIGLSISNPGNHGIQILNPGNNGIVISGADNDGITISADNDGIVISADDEGARIIGRNLGVYASGGATQSDVPDIILGSSNNSLFSDDGIISTNPLRSGSDMFLRSYDAVVVQLDYDNNEAGNFRIRNGNQDVVFDVNESGNLSFDGRLEIGTGVVESLSQDIRINTNDDVLIILDNDNNETGFFGIYNGNTSDAVFQVVDSGDAFLAGSLSQNSDRRLKTNIQDLKYGLNEILKLKPKQYHWKNKEQTKKSLGLIAQEVQPIIKEVVTTQDNAQKTLGVSYTELIPVLIKAIQEQQEIISNQNSKIEDLSVELTQIKSMDARLNQLEILLKSQ